MARFKVIEHSSGIEQIVNPIAVYARSLRIRALALDTETTGSGAEDEVIELGVVRASNGEVLFDGQFKPSKQIEPGAFAVHRISDAELAGKPCAAEVWDELFPILDGVTCVAWNAAYDSRLLANTARKYALPEPRVEWVCVMKLYREFRGLPKNCKLEDACRALGVRRGSHRAITDALAAARVLYRMADAAPEDEVITYDAGGQDEDDEAMMTASDFLTQFGWRERKRLAPDGGEMVSQWIDPEGGRICDFLPAMEMQRGRMK
jgi:DNA polymerase III epsilon subunit-like protein